MAKNSFTPSFKDLDRDIDRYLDAFGDWDRSGPTPMVRGYDVALRTVFDLYLEHESFDAVVHYLLKHRNNELGLNDDFFKASDRLRRDGQVNRLKRLWRGVVSVQRLYFWELRGYREVVQIDKSIAEAKKVALDTMSQYRDILVAFDMQDDIRELDTEMELLREERRRTTDRKPDPRVMDQEVFWEIIEQAGAGTTNVAERVEAIASALEAFRPREIKAFQKLLETRLAEAYSWDIWALAYLAQDGCSDDAFEAFRPWLVLQGRSVFERALGGIEAVLEDVPMGLEASAESLLMAAPMAFEARSGKMMKIAPARAESLKGEPWEESDLARRYPKVVRHYDRRGST